MSIIKLHPSELKISDFTYELPEDKVAKYPLSNRSASKLLIYKKGKIKEDIYERLDQYLHVDSFLAFNQTKVIHARLLFKKATGASIEIFCLEPDTCYSSISDAMNSVGEVFWKCMVGGASKWKDHQKLTLKVLISNNKNIHLEAKQEEKRNGYFIIKFKWSLRDENEKETSNLTFSEILHHLGNLPIPPYLNRKAEDKDEETYQTVFAKEEGSVAAPTAALHFTNELISKLNQKGITSGFLTLHVGAGTFKPVKSENMNGHEMHAEWIEVSKPFLENLLFSIKNNKKIIAVGTTSSRTLESLYWIGVKISKKEWNVEEEIGIPQWYPYSSSTTINLQESMTFILNFLAETNQDKIITKTQILIAPGYEFKVIDALITNFHQPQSTLLLLVAALIGEDWKSIYQYALNNEFRFLSYGDGCLLWK